MARPLRERLLSKIKVNTETGAGIGWAVTSAATASLMLIERRNTHIAYPTNSTAAPYQMGLMSFTAAITQLAEILTICFLAAMLTTWQIK